MDAFKRAYRDPKSPLTPITPLSSNHAFNFEMSVKMGSTPTSALTPKQGALPYPRYPHDFQAVRQGFEAIVRSAPSHVPPVRCMSPVKTRRPFTPCQPTAAAGGGGGGHQGFRKSSPILPAPLCQKVKILLARAGLIKYADLFEREDIDLQIFCSLTDKELQQLGIRSSEERRGFRKVVDWFLKKCPEYRPQFYY